MSSFQFYPTIDQTFKRIKILFDSFGEIDYIGEPVSIVEHSLQAGYFAKRELGGKEDEEFILACLFHDIGHILGLEAELEMKMGNCGIMDHEGIGGNFMYSLGFSERVCELVRSHVQAKRYLCGTNPNYYSELSEASKTTLGYQGGPMSTEECEKFVSNPLFEWILLARRVDELAKVENGFGLGKIPTLQDYYELIVRNLQLRKEQDLRNGISFFKSQIPRNLSLVKSGYILSQVQIDQFQTNSYLKLSNFLPYFGITVEQLHQWVKDICSWPKAENKWLLHHELSTTNPDEKLLCRIENFANYHNEIGVLTKDWVLNLVSQLFQESAVLLKEKINFKLPGGAGFSCHQDTPAYLGLGESHISVMVAIDDATLENGCLEVAPGQWVKGQVHLNSDGVVIPEEESNMKFFPLTCKAGDIVFFSGYIPHRSKPNLSNKSRRAMFLTYNSQSDGDFHDQYYAAKHAKKHGFSADHAISFQNDFQGKIVD